MQHGGVSLFETTAYRTGPVLLVHAKSGRVHSEFRGLDSSLRATNSADVATIACLEESRSLVGHYTDGAAGYTIVWEVNLIDIKGGALWALAGLEAVAHLARRAAAREPVIHREKNYGVGL